jgi:hypothetical protein
MNLRAVGPTLVLVALLSGCPRKRTPPSTQPIPAGARAPQGAAGAFADWYPDDITLPSGVQYPCDVSPLPRDLVGIPDDERAYVNHVCACLILVMREKQVLLTSMGQGGDASSELASYRSVADAALVRLRAEPIPRGLEPFHEDMIAAIELHQTFFAQAVPRRAAGESMEAVHTIAEGHTAADRLLHAWSVINARYGKTWAPAVNQSVYHHLCGFDLF